tara:strand:+ start:503 stop:661 length:159 start_codon:yes stop_codon:yes gene_type:complete
MVKAKKQGEYHWDKGDVSWSPAPPKKKKKKTESLIERLKRQKEEKERLIQMM